MTTRLTAALLATAIAWPAAARAQETVWLQIEARQTVSGASSAARSYAQRLENVAGFALGNGFYGIALGPYSQQDAQTLSRQLKAQGAIPQDAYIVSGDSYAQQFYPVGTGVSLDAQPLPGEGEADETAAALTPEDLASGAAAAIDAAEQTAAAEAPAPQPEPEETRQEAIRSEQQLSRDEKRELQIALEWAGFYDAAIDGLVGPGTRRAMRGWQEDQGLEPTGVLTTRQREQLISDYNAVLEGLGLALVRDDASGIEMQMPTEIVAFTEYQPPFAKFEGALDGDDVQVLLISQPGDEDRFFGLYEILQTLEIVPQEGERSRGSTEFTIDGIGAERRTHVYATRADGAIKGFVLVWPAGDDERFRRVLDEMRGSFTRIDGVLDPAIAPPGDEQGVNLVAGLEIRQPELSRSGFFIDGSGTVVTTSEVADGCDDLTVGGDYAARVVHADPDLGVSVLRPEEALSPRRVASFQTATPRLRAEVAVAGYPYGGILSAPAMSFGTLADIRGLQGEEELKRLELRAEAGDAGGPLLDNGGAVLGMLLPREMDGRVLPADTSFAADAEAIVASLDAAGIGVETTSSIEAISPELLTLRAAEMTVLVSCW